MAQISSDMGGCISWSQLTTPPTSGLNYVIISKNGGPGYDFTNIQFYLSIPVKFIIFLTELSLFYWKFLLLEEL